MGTTSQRSVLKQLDLQAIFNRELAVPNVSSHKELVCIVNRSMIMKIGATFMSSALDMFWMVQNSSIPLD
jgi:hypothetical protein